MKNIRILWLGVLAALVPATVQAAVAPQFYTTQAVAGARANVKNTTWGWAESEKIISYAQPWLKMSYDQLWNFLSEQSVPRALFAGQPARCPIHGSLEAHGSYAFETVPEQRWKVRCPVGGETWPTNDFEAFYKSGKNARNEFDPSRANRKLLTSQDSKRPYGVDDGAGYVDGSGKRYYFVAYYGFWGIWSRVARSDYNAISVLSQAYLLTGDKEYGRRAALLLARAADLYPALDAGAWAARGVPVNDGGSGLGKALGNIWDDQVANNLMMAYDALGPLIDSDATTQQMLGGYARRFGLTPQASGADIRKHIEGGLLASVAQAVINRQIRSNEGRAQYTFALATLLRGSAAIPSGLDWLNAPGATFNGGGHIPQLFWSLIDRDGAGNESSPYYNSLWLESLQPLAAVMHKMDQNQNLLAQYPRMRKLMLYPSRLMNLKRYFPHISDAGGTGSPEAPLPQLAERYVKAFLQFGDEDAGVAAYQLNGESLENLHAGLFDGDAHDVESKISAAVDKRGRQWERSENLNGYGLAQHRAGSNGYARTMWLYWGRTGNGGNHPHADRLNLGLFAYGLDLLPDLGYPEYAIAWPTTQGWIKNTAAHNTVVVDGRRQVESYTGDQKIFADTPYVQFSEVDGGPVYPQTSLYRRSAALIQIDSKRSYMVDLFRVKGGSDHVFSFHAAEGAATPNGVTLNPQPGTYAGAGVSYGSFYDEPFSGKYAGSGFQFLDQVAASSDAPATFSVDWAIKDTYGELPEEWVGKVHLRYTAVGNTAQVALADGRPAQNNGSNPRRLRYLLLRNRGSNVQSRFLGVIEPYVSTSGVIASRLLDLKEAAPDAVALEIKLDTGRTDYVFSSLDNVAHTTADGRFTFQGRYAVIAEKGGELAYAFLADGSAVTVDGETVAKATTAQGALTAVNVDASGHATVTLDKLVSDNGSLTGQWVDFAPKNSASDANYQITRVANANGTSKLLLGDADAVNGLRDTGNPAAGLLTSLAPGDGYRLPGLAFERGPAYEALTVEAPLDVKSVKSQGANGGSSGGCAAGGDGGYMAAGALLILALLRQRGRR